VKLPWGSTKGLEILCGKILVGNRFAISSHSQKKFKSSGIINERESSDNQPYWSITQVMQESSGEKAMKAYFES